MLDDPSHELDVIRAIEAAFQAVAEQAAQSRVQEILEALDATDLRRWFRTQFFRIHAALYTAVRRRAPIYWQLATPSSSYSIWLYYPRLTGDTLFRLLNDYIGPRVRYEERKLAHVTQEAGANPTSRQRREIDDQQSFAAELRAFRDEVARVAPLWSPDLNDGVMINFAPLWRLVPHDRSWQRECKKVWDELVAGVYDWTHLAMRLWPQRVVPRCADDRSLAIAHGLEGVFWIEDDGKWASRRVSRDVVDRLVEERTSAAIKSAVDDLLGTPTPAASSRGRRAGGRGGHPASGRKAAASRPDARTARSTADKGTREAVREAIAAARDGASKSDVIKATGISNLSWDAAINALLVQGVVTRTGAARGTRYHLAEKGDRT